MPSKYIWVLCWYLLNILVSNIMDVRVARCNCVTLLGADAGIDISRSCHMFTLLSVCELLYFEFTVKSNLRHRVCYSYLRQIWDQMWDSAQLWGYIDIFTNLFWPMLSRIIPIVWLQHFIHDVCCGDIINIYSSHQSLFSLQQRSLVW